MFLSPNAQAFLAKNPTRIAIVGGFAFYECPTHGDEAPLRALTPDGKLKTSPFWDAPSAEDVNAWGGQ